MLWQGRRQSSNVSDRRGMGGRGIAIGGGLIGLVVYLVNFFLSGGDPAQLQQPGINRNSEPMTTEEQAKDDQRAAFVKVVLAETEDVWHKLFRENGSEY